ncbi:hypothetical protein PO027_18170 [Bacteroides thetaiotaomicron]|uniref:hypothetical protein n=1 Tax=Bacteroides thetaiotaomicron TaxID=818 RepID=UPI0023311812|nr:hypothetical protein [Bacteroides thetaiotaomicron]MDC2008627.1 hypothetical protein [Bacteroides thetaiotaomicron]MDC2022940.1 hypothetical protein [Bacteroides thetaiotaomicron]MDC2025336.1 hypothetical protein [Bacteroides thetaiotaomicron]MDC2032047.1 hypothetical protein [Bacteroides thetaiotaomicron]MDC2062914.1 hypothetical protein [Bacteroides thetaiotaomicron]
MRTNEIFTLESRGLNEGKKVAFIAGGINRDINKANVKAKIKSIEECGQLSELEIVDGEDVVNEGLSLKDPMSGLPIENEKAKDYLAITDGQHRYMAIMALREEDRCGKKNYEEAARKWQKNGSNKEDKPKEYTPKAPAHIKARYPLNDNILIQTLITEVNNTSVKWDKGDFARQAFAMYPDNEVLKFIAKYMDMQHQKAKKGEVDDMLPNGGFKLTTLSKYLIYSADIKESVLADTCKYGEDILIKYVGNEPNKLVERAEAIIKAGLDAGFTYRFLAKGFFIDWITKKIGLGVQYTELLEKLKDVNREVVDSIMREAQKHNFMEQLNRIG